MSGVAEASLVLGLISSIISVIQICSQLYEAVKDETNLHKSVRGAAARLPAIQKVLEKAKDQPWSSSFEGDLQRCQANFLKLNTMFHELIPAKESSFLQKTRIAAKSMRQGSKVEEIIKNINEDLNNLQRYQVFQLPTRDQLKADLKEMQKNPELEMKISYFKTSNYESFKDDVNRRRIPGTCEWFLRHERFLKWRDSSKDEMLWLSADPGCGKSILARALVDEGLVSRGPSETTVLYFFFKDNPQQDHATAAVCAIVHQLLKAKPSLFTPEAKRATEVEGNSLKTDFEALWKIFITAAKDPKAGCVVCVLDALDECNAEDRKKIISKISTTYAAAHERENDLGTLKFLATSRPYTEIESAFSFATENVSEIRLAGEAESEDISKEIGIVIENEVTRIAKTKKLGDVARLQLRNEIMAISHRTYLWLKFVLEEVESASAATPKELDKIIKRLPKSINDAYEKMLSRSKDKAQAREVLQMVVIAERPLTLDEIDILMGLDEQCSTTKDIDLAGPEAREIQIRELCQLFITVVENRIYLIHQTAKTFLLSQSSIPANNELWKCSITPQMAHNLMADKCMRYLLCSDVHERCSHINIRIARNHLDRRIEALTKEQPFLRYSATYWTFHFVQSQSIATDSSITLANQLHAVGLIVGWSVIQRDEDLRYLAATGISPPSVVQQAVFGHHVLFGQDISPAAEGVAAALFWAAGRGHQETVKALLDRGIPVDTPSRPPTVFGLEAEDETPLLFAASRGHTEVVTVLLDRGARAGISALTKAQAFVSNQSTIMRLLLERGVDSDTQAKEFDAALCAASHFGDIDLIRTLLECSAHVAPQGKDFSNALNAASRSHSIETYKILLEHCPDVHARAGWDRGKALRTACSSGHLDLIKLLLEHGADVNAQLGPYSSVLSEASQAGNIDIVKLLLEHGADVNAQGRGRGNYGSALCVASILGHIDVVKLLLEHGADVNALAGGYMTALTEASFGGKINTVKLLLEHGAEVNAHGGQDGPALIAASLGGNIDIVRLLLEHGAEVNAQGGECGTALCAASQIGDIDIVRLLLEHDADVNAQVKGKYGSALIAASWHGKADTVKLLLEHGAEVNYQEGADGNALCAASAAGHIDVAKLLLVHGAEVNAQGGCNGTALCSASYSENADLVRLLLESGADVHASQNGLWDSPLAAACASGDLDIIRMLLDRKADVNIMRKESGGSALQTASRWGHVDAVCLLLKRGADVNLQRKGFNMSAVASREAGSHLYRLLDVNWGDPVLGCVTALQAACIKGHTNVVGTLLKHGAAVNAQGGLYGNALQAAEESGDLALVSMLLERGATREGGELRRHMLEVRQHRMSAREAELEAEDPAGMVGDSQWLFDDETLATENTG